MADPVVIPDDQEQFKLNEVCKLANVQPYMLRFWGTEFPQLEAAKSGTGQRLYTRDQVETILEIRRLLFDEGLTIAGARKKLEQGGGRAAAKPKAPARPKQVVAAEPEDVVAEEAEDGEAEEEKEAPAAKPAPKPAATTSSARRSVASKESAAPASARTAEVDKKGADNVQPLLATLKSVRDEIDTILAELKSE